MIVNPLSGGTVPSERRIKMDFVLICRPLPRLFTTAERNLSLNCFHFLNWNGSSTNRSGPYREAQSLFEPFPFVTVIPALATCIEAKVQARRHWLLSDANIEEAFGVGYRVELGQSTKG